MPESSRFWNTNATGDGPASGTGYSQQQWYDLLRKSFTDGVVAGEGGELAVSGSATPLSVAAGAAWVYGLFYENTTALNLVVATPAATTGGRVVLRANWAAQTVRATVVLSASGVATPPALVQTAGTTWDISLATFTITNAGVITRTDARTFCHFGTHINRARVDGMGGTGRLPYSDSNGRLTDSSALTYNNHQLVFTEDNPASIVDMRVANTHASNAASHARVLAQSAAGGGDAVLGLGLSGLTNWYIGADRSDSGKLKFGATGGEPIPGAGDVLAINSTGQLEISPASPAAPLVLSANGQGQKVTGLHADEVSTLGLRRQGGDATNWGNTGSTTYTPAAARMQVGATGGTGPVAASGTFTVTYPVAFSATPILMLTAVGSNGALLGISLSSATGFTVAWQFVSGASISPPQIQWLAIGPE